MYIAQTKRCLNKRIYEYQYNIRKTKTPYTVLSNHCINNLHSFKWEDTNILDEEDNYYQRMFSEMFFIKSNDNTRNIKDDTNKLNPISFVKKINKQNDLN